MESTCRGVSALVGKGSDKSVTVNDHQIRLAGLEQEDQQKVSLTLNLKTNQ